MSDTAAFVDGKDEEYLPHILYIKEGDPNCDRVIEFANRHGLYSHIYIQDVYHSKPGWLKGVPTMITHQTKAIAERRVEGVNGIMGYIKAIGKGELGMAGRSNMVAAGSDPLRGVGINDEGMWSDPGPNPSGQNVHQNTSTPNMSQKSQRRADEEAATNSAVEQYKASRAALDSRTNAMYSTTAPPPR